MARKDIGAIIPVERIHRYIYLLRGEKVILDKDLAELYVQTKGTQRFVGSDESTDQPCAWHRQGNLGR